MNKFYLYSVLSLCLLPPFINGDYTTVSAYYRLKTAIYDGYDQMIRPVKSPSTVTNVTIGFTLKQVLSFVSSSWLVELWLQAFISFSSWIQKDDQTESITLSGWPNMVTNFSLTTVARLIEWFVSIQKRILEKSCSKCYIYSILNITEKKLSKNIKKASSYASEQIEYLLFYWFKFFKYAKRISNFKQVNQFFLYCSLQIIKI